MNDTQHESHFYDTDGKPAGGISSGIGYTIGWQNGPCLIHEDGSQPDRNGAFLIEVLEACRKTKKIAGIATWDAASAQRRLDQGFLFVTVGGDDGWMLGGAQETLKKLGRSS